MITLWGFVSLKKIIAPETDPFKEEGGASRKKFFSIWGQTRIGWKITKVLGFSYL